MLSHLQVGYYHLLRKSGSSSMLHKDERRVYTFSARAHLINYTAQNPALVQRISDFSATQTHSMEVNDQITDVLNDVKGSVSLASIPWTDFSKKLSGSEYKALYSPSPLSFLEPTQTTGDGNCWLEAFYVTAQDRGVDLHNLPSGGYISQFHDLRHEIAMVAKEHIDLAEQHLIATDGRSPDELANWTWAQPSAWYVGTGQVKAPQTKMAYIHFLQKNRAWSNAYALQCLAALIPDRRLFVHTIDNKSNALAHIAPPKKFGQVDIESDPVQKYIRSPPPLLAIRDVDVVLRFVNGNHYEGTKLCENYKAKKRPILCEQPAPKRIKVPSSQAKVSLSRRACVAARPRCQEGPQGCTIAGRLLGKASPCWLDVGRWRPAHLVWLPAAAC
jgi:hypothetical protein